MKMNRLVITTGFALFSMFFGSGNLVFPITVGQESQGYYLSAALGILSSGVLVPFLGVFGMVLYNGDINSFFQAFGKRGIFIFSLLSLALMGPFGVLARCLTVSHGALALLLPNLSLPLCSLGLCILIFFLSLNKNKIIHLIGCVLTPFMLLAIGAIAAFGLWNNTLPEISSGEAWNAFSNGVYQGYQTMDLLAAFFFSQFIIHQLRSQLIEHHQEKYLLPVFCKAAMIGIAALSSIYVILVCMGNLYSPLLVNVAPQEMLGRIALESLGELAAPCVCVAMVFACLTTAIVLASLFADFLKDHVCKQKISRPLSLLATLAISFAVSTLDFNGISKFLGPILEAIYPALILLTLINIGIYAVKRSVGSRVVD